MRTAIWPAPGSSPVDDAGEARLMTSLTYYIRSKTERRTAQRVQTLIGYDPAMRVELPTTPPETDLAGDVDRTYRIMVTIEEVPDL
jgi:hypothetical protein